MRVMLLRDSTLLGQYCLLFNYICVSSFVIGLSLGDLLRPELILPLIDSLPLNERLASYLPEGDCSPEEFIEVLQSPPFRQQVDSFTYVLKTGQVDLTQFGIDPSKYKFTILSFLEALEDSVSETQEGEGSRMVNSDPMDEGK
ncbi:unnamed protein product [Rhodiola kirilowii]